MSTLTITKKAAGLASWRRFNINSAFGTKKAVNGHHRIIEDFLKICIGSDNSSGFAALAAHNRTVADIGRAGFALRFFVIGQ